MSDIKGVEIHDVLGISEPLTKLIETVSGGIGKLYEPTHIKRIAKAKAEEVKFIGEKISDFNALPIKYDAGKVMIDGTDFSELAKRANGRLVFQELKKQNNIDNVVGYAAQDLSNEKVVSEQPVDIDWVTRFFDSVSDVSSEDMQRIWGKILAGEVKQPGSFSLRTLETVRNMSQKDAELFMKVVPFLVSTNSERSISSDDTLLEKYGLSYGIIMILSECGLINSSTFLTLNLHITKEKDCIICTSERIALLRSIGNKSHEISFGAYTLTRVGRDLFSIVDAKPNNKYFSDFVKHIDSHNKGKIFATIHHVNKIEGDKINYKREPIETIGKES